MHIPFNGDVFTIGHYNIDVDLRVFARDSLINYLISYGMLF
jgi:hypothetical protein